MSGFSIVDDFEPIRVLTQIRTATDAELATFLSRVRQMKLDQLAAGEKTTEVFTCVEMGAVSAGQRTMWEAWLEKHADLLAQTTLAIAVVTKSGRSDETVLPTQLAQLGVAVEVFADPDQALCWAIEQVQDDDDMFLPPQLVMGGVAGFRCR